MIRAHCTVREHDLLLRSQASGSAGGNRIPAADFDALKALIVDADDDPDAVDAADAPAYGRLFRLRNARNEVALQICNFAGVIQTPSGLQIEVLPKIGASHDDARNTLVRMLRTAGQIPPLPIHQASLSPVRLPLMEFFFSQFLDAVTHLLKRGLLSGYERVQRNSRFLKGRLLIGRHLQHNLANAERFFVEHDLLRLDRPENRLIRSALDTLATMAKDAGNQKLCRELVFAFDDVPPSREVRADLERCVKDRSLSHYADALTWARLILLRLQPIGRGGSARVHALLFPMERLFEQCVGAGLRKRCRHPSRIRAQSGARNLATHKGAPCFQLRPDYVVEHAGAPNLVLDAKWKRIDASGSASGRSYGLTRADLYQLYAYGNKYLDAANGIRTVVLVYPRTPEFPEALEPFEYEPGHVLHVIPYDLERCELVPPPTLTALSD